VELGVGSRQRGDRGNSYATVKGRQRPATATRPSRRRDCSHSANPRARDGGEQIDGRAFRSSTGPIGRSCPPLRARRLQTSNGLLGRGGEFPRLRQLTRKPLGFGTMNDRQRAPLMASVFETATTSLSSEGRRGSAPDDIPAWRKAGRPRHRCRLRRLENSTYSFNFERAHIPVNGIALCPEARRYRSPGLIRFLRDRQRHLCRGPVTRTRDRPRSLLQDEGIRARWLWRYQFRQRS